jgi:integrase-like protein
LTFMMLDRGGESGQVVAGSESGGAAAEGTGFEQPPQPHHVRLNNTAIAALRIFLGRGDGTGRVVRNAQGETLVTYNHWWWAALRDAGIKDFHWHDLRHTGASRLMMRGATLRDVQEFLGHSNNSLTTTARYTLSPMITSWAWWNFSTNQLTPQLTPPLWRARAGNWPSSTKYVCGDCIKAGAGDGNRIVSPNPQVLCSDGVATRFSFKWSQMESDS